VSALLIVGHGTRDELGAAEFRDFVGLVRRRAAEKGAADAVAGGFIELSPPPLKDAVSDLVAQGHRELTAVPLILLAAGHAKGDIPAALARERERHPGLRTRYARPLGPHPVILELLRRRLRQTLEVSAAADTGSAPDAVLLVGRGTTDPDANADLYRAGRLLWETSRDLGVRQVEAAFVSLARPSVAEGLDRLRALGARNIVVLPFFLFPGVLPTRIHAQTAEWLEGCEGAAHAVVAEVIGGCDELADLVLERYAEADGRGASPVGMNCDACVYRIAMPGFEDRVGREQRPHDHPEDPAHPHGHHHAHDHAHDHPHPHGHASAREHEHDHDHAHLHDLGRSAPETRVSGPTTSPSPPMG
jgi:sirohydrochlorin cobaltochelatase